MALDTNSRLLLMTNKQISWISQITNKRLLQKIVQNTNVIRHEI